jgi:hypothetical protein
MRGLERTPTTDRDDRPMARTYVSVLVLQALVLTALWVAGRYFGSL